jgi:hypothetical protein
MSTLTLTPGTPPVDAPFPPTSLANLLNLIAAYVDISGLESLEGVIIQPTEPGAGDRDKAWIKTDATTSLPLGLFIYFGGWNPVPGLIPYSATAPVSPVTGTLWRDPALGGSVKQWNGSAWTTNLWPTGNTASRPTGVPDGFIYNDAEIGIPIVKRASGWSTLGGSIGDVKMVDYATTSGAEAANPGWSVFASFTDRFPVGYSGTKAPQLESVTTVQSGTGTDLPFKAMIFLRKDF